MTYNKISTDSLAVLSHILSDAEVLLLDFDGPVCSVFAGFPAPVVARQLRETMVRTGRHDLPFVVAKSDDPFDVLKFAAKVDDDDARYVEAALRAHEVEAIATAEPTAGAHELIRLWHAYGRKLAIVSNNSTEAVEAYLHLHELIDFVDCISSRTGSNPGLLKPNPFLILQAVAKLGASPANCVLVGDSTTDIQAARSAGVPSVAYANRAEKLNKLNAEQPAVVITDITQLTALVGQFPDK